MLGVINRRRLMARGAVLPALAAAASLPPAVAAQVEVGAGELERVSSRGRVVAGTGDDNPPWHSLDVNGELTGFDVELARCLAEALCDDPTRLELVVQSAEGWVANLTADLVDVVFPAKALRWQASRAPDRYRRSSG
jgi:polar amino acid transport system substrate-binding protein